MGLDESNSCWTGRLLVN